jgi:hypothetical protein
VGGRERRRGEKGKEEGEGRETSMANWREKMGSESRTLGFRFPGFFMVTRTEHERHLGISHSVQQS